MLIKAYNQIKFEKELKQLQEYCDKFKSCNNEIVQKEKDYLSLLKKINTHANNKKTANLLIVKGIKFIVHETRLQRLGIKVDCMMVSSRNWVGGYVQKYCDGWTTQALILTVKKMP